MRKEFLKRFLPIILSVAMVFQSVPNTVYAAENVSEETVAEATVAEESEADEVVVEEAADDEIVAEAANDEVVAEVADDEVVVEEAADDEVVAEAADDETVTDADVESSEETDETVIEAAEPVAVEIDVQKADLISWANKTTTTKYFYDAKTDTFHATYGETPLANPFEDFMKQLVTGLEIKTDDVNNAGTIKEYLAYQWQEETNGKYADMAEAANPNQAGNYKLVIAVDKTVAAAEPVELSFVIDKAVIKWEFADPDATFKVVNNSSVGDLIEKVTKEIYVAQTDPTSRDVFVKDIKVIVKEAAASDDAKLANADKLDKKKDYVVKVTATPIDDKNNEVEEGYYNVTFADPIPTKVNVALNDTTKSTFEYIYSKEAIAAPTAFTYKVTADDDKDGVYDADVKVDETANIKYVWKDGSKNEMESAPVNAGVYYYSVQYEDETLEYDKSDADIRVEILPATIKVVPELPADATYFAGQTARDILADVTYKVLDPSGAEMSIDRNKFWGVSYSLDQNKNYWVYDSNIGGWIYIGAAGEAQRFQSYEPIFVVERKLASDTEWHAIGNGVKLAYTGEFIKEDGTRVEENFSYRVVFSGDKCVYSENGAVKDRVSAADLQAMCAERNYSVDVTKLAESVCAAKIEKQSNITIDVDKMLIGGKGKSLDDMYTKVYDGKNLYADKKEYKVAVAKDASGAEVASGTALTYTWYGINTAVKKDDAGKDVVFETNSWLLENPTKPHYFNLPSDAGEYKLVVTYSDASKGLYAESAYVYFKIEPQKLKLVANPKNLEVYSGTEITNPETNGIFDLSVSEAKLMLIPDNKEDAKAEELKETGFEYDADYLVRWYVFESTDIVDSGDVSASYNKVYGSGIAGNVYSRLDITYRLATFTTMMDAKNANNYEIIGVYDDNENKVADLDTWIINVKKMGTEEIRFELDKDKIDALVKEKAYDGTPFTVSLNGLVKAYTVMGDVDVTDKIDLEAMWDYTDKEGYTVTKSLSPDADAATYELFAVFRGDSVYKNNEIKVADFVIRPRKVTVSANLAEVITAGTRTDDYQDSGLPTTYPVILNDKTPFTLTMELNPGEKEYTEYYLEKAGDSYLPRIFSYRFGYEFDTDGDGKADTTIYDNLIKNIYKLDKETYEGYYFRFGKNYSYAPEFTGGTYGLNFASYYKDTTCVGKKLAGEYHPEEDHYWYYKNYEFVYEPVFFTPTERGASTVITTATDVLATNRNLTKINSIIAADEAKNITVTPVSGIPYKVITDPVTNETVEGNFITILIMAPDEFIEDRIGLPFYSNNDTKHFVYNNSIRNNGGYVLDTSDLINRGWIYATFKIEEKDETKSFQITWEDGYTETYVLNVKDAVLMPNLEAATMPKALKFNGVNTKMTAGESQQLDVKVTKTLPKDVVVLRYSVIAGADVVSVDEHGYLTALKPGKATVEVYPVHLDEDGKEVKIPEWKKATKVNITVKDVTAPKIKAVKYYDNYAIITYLRPSDGYRQEIYTTASKGKKPADFEAMIAQMKNGKADGIVNNIILDAQLEDLNWDNNPSTVEVWVGGLSAYTDYTFYVRNVSGIRELADGSSVAYSHSGSVKSIRTTKVQLDALSLSLNVPDYKSVVPATKPDYAADFHGIRTYSVGLSENVINLSTEGNYIMSPAYEAADYYDDYWWKLPMEKSLQASYQVPKLGYYAVTDANDFLTVKTKEYGLKVGDRYYRKSQIASVAKGGKVTLKGVGRVDIIVYDSISGWATSTYTRLNIHADLTAITAKSTKATVGNYFDPTPYLTFISNGKKLIGGADVYGWDNLIVTIENDTQALKRVDNSTFYVAKPNETVTLTIKSALFKDVPAATMTVKTSALPALKALKATDVFDDCSSLMFTYSATDLNDLKFIVNVMDAKNRVVYSEAVTDLVKEDTNFLGYYLDSFYYDSQAGLYTTNYDNVKGKEKDTAYYYYDAKKKVYVFYYYGINNLVRKSNYTVEVTPFFDETLKGKTSKTKIKTTDVPVSYEKLGNNKNRFGYLGGTNVRVLNNNNITNLTANATVFLSSGNTYTVVLNDAMKQALTIGSDKITWKSNNSKVAKVKAVGLGESATFTTNKQGVAEIEARSKITKKTIARLEINVKAVKNAEYSYGTYNTYDEAVKALYAGGLLNNEKDIQTVTEQNKVRTNLKANEWSTVMFVAPCDGVYKFVVDEPYAYGWGWNSPDAADGSRTEIPITDPKTGSTFITKGTVATYTVQGQKVVSVVGTHYDRLPLGTETENAFMFYVPSDGTYIIYAMTEDGKKYVNATLCVKKTGDTIDSAKLGLTAGGKYGVEKVESLNATKTQIKGLKADELKYYTYTAALTGEYVFTAQDSVSQNLLDKHYKIFDKDGNVVTDWQKINNKVDDTTYDVSKEMNEGDVIVIRVKGHKDEIDTTIDVKVPSIKELKDGREETYSLAKGESQWIAINIDDENTTYKVWITSATAGVDVSYWYYDDKLVGLGNGQTTATGTTVDFTLNNPKKFEEGQKAYIKITTDVSENKADVKVKYNMAIAKDLKNGVAETVSISGNDIQFFSFVAPYNGSYVIKGVATNKKDTGKVTFAAYEAGKDKLFDMTTLRQIGGDNTSLEADNLAFYDEYHFDKGQNILFKVRGNNDGTAASTVEVSATFIEPTEIKDTVDLATASMNKGTVKYYQYTVAKTGDYTLALSSETTSNLDVRYVKATDFAKAKRGDDNLWTTIGTVNGLKSGETLYIRTVATTDDECKGKLTITSPEALAADFANGAEVNVSENGASETYRRLKTMEAGVYRVTFDPYDTADPHKSYVRYDGNYYLYGDEIVIPKNATTKLLTIGQTGTAGKVKVTLTKVEPKEIKAGITETTIVSANSTQWYKFVVQNSGRYGFSKEGGNNINLYAPIRPEVDTNGNTLYYHILDMTASIGDYRRADRLDNQFLTKGTEVYLRVSTTETSEQTTKITVTKLGGKELKLGELEPLTVSSNKAEWYTYTVKEEGYYNVGLVSGNGLSTNSIVSKIYRNNEITGKAYAPVNTEVQRYNVGDVLLICCSTSNTDFETDKVFVKKEEVVPLTEGKRVDATFKAGETKYFVYTYPKDDTAEIILIDADPKDISLMNTNTDVSKMTSFATDQYWSGRCDVATEKIIGLRATAITGAETKKIGIKAGLVNYNHIKAGGTLSVTLTKNERYYYQLDLEEDGRYVVSKTKTDWPVASELKGRTANVIDGYNSLTESTFEESDEIVYKKTTKVKGGDYVKAVMNTASDNTAFTLKVEKVTATVVDSVSNNVSVPASKTVWYSYKAPATGYYTVKTSNVSANLTCAIFDSMTAKESEKLSPGKIKLDKGKEIFIRVKNGDSDNSGKATLEFQEEETATFEVKDDNKLTVSNNYVSVYARFTAPTSGFYKYEFVDEYYSEYTSYTVLGEGNHPAIGTQEYFLEAGESIIFTIGNPSSNPEPLDAVVKIKKTADIVEATDVNLAAGEKFSYKFAADTAGTYVFFSDFGKGKTEATDTVLYVYQDETKKDLINDSGYIMSPIGDDGGEGNNYLWSANSISDGTEYYLVAKAYDDANQINFVFYIAKRR